MIYRVSGNNIPFVVLNFVSILLAKPKDGFAPNFKGTLVC